MTESYPAHQKGNCKVGLAAAQGVTARAYCRCESKTNSHCKQHFFGIRFIHSKCVDKYRYFDRPPKSLDKCKVICYTVTNREGASLWCKPEVGPESGELTMGRFCKSPFCSLSAERTTWSNV